ncbi:TPA: hypothetical protein ACY37P_002191 [Pasteurella multocida]|nr:MULTISPECIES: hypothetical protein [Pasteurella]WRK07860.1 hypothetical protein RFF38_03265 [Pasteurella multocida]
MEILTYIILGFFLAPLALFASFFVIGLFCMALGKVMDIFS